MEIPGPVVQDYLPFLEFMLSDGQFGEMFLKFSDSAAYGNNLLHVCVELHNIDFTTNSKSNLGGEGNSISRLGPVETGCC